MKTRQHRVARVRAPATDNLCSSGVAVRVPALAGQAGTLACHFVHNGTASNCCTTAAPTALCCSAFGSSTALSRTEHRVHELASAAAELLWAAQHRGVVAAKAARFTSWRLQCECAPRGDRARPIAAWGGERRHGRRCCRSHLCLMCKGVRLTQHDSLAPDQMKPSRTST